MTDDGEALSSADPGSPIVGPTALATVFVSDPSAEAGRVAHQLRAAGYVVVDVPSSLLVGRVAVQLPSVVVLDGEGGAAEAAVSELRAAPGGEGIHVVLLGPAPEGGESAAFARCRWFSRPVDVALLVQEVDKLTGGPSVPPPSPARKPDASSSARPPPSSSPRLDAPLSSRDARPPVSLPASLSPELEMLLADAERRIGPRMAPASIPPTPEEEIEAVVPLALLEALDEPIDDDEQEAMLDAPPSRADGSEGEGEGRAGTHAGRDASARTHAGRELGDLPREPDSALSLGVAPTMPPPMPATGEVSVVVVEPPPLSPSVAPPSPDATLASRALVLTEQGDVTRQLAAGIAARSTGCYGFDAKDGIRRVVLRDGDVVTAASSADDEALLAFLAGRGDLRRDQVKDFTGKLPPFGRHAGAALVGHGLLRQDQLWPTLRAHAEWLLGRMLLLPRATMRLEAEAPGRLKQEPGVFGGSSGAEVLVEVARRVIGPEEATRRLGGPGATMADGPTTLLGECALDATLRAAVEQGRGETIEAIAARAEAPDAASALYALSLLGVITVAPPGTVARVGAREGAPRAEAGGVDELDLAAIRERVRARSELVAEADYFTLLGVSREATGYEVRRAYLELRRAFEPARVLTPELADLEDDLRTILVVLDEAYDILRDGARRERYRRALGD